jgi:uncharacterized protein (DUF2384 family)
MIAFCRYLIFLDIRRKEMTRSDKDEEREERIHMEIIVDAYGPEEQAMSWYNYLSDTLQFPFSARCIVRLPASPLEPGEEVKVVAMAPDEACEHDMLVSIQWNRRQFAVPLMQLEGLRVDEETQQAIEDWQYWVDRGSTL